MLDDVVYGGHSGGHGGHHGHAGGHGKQSYVHEEHEEVRYDSDGYSDHGHGYHGHSGGLKLKPSHHMSAHKVHGDGWGHGHGHGHGGHYAQQQRVGHCGRPLPPAVDYFHSPTGQGQYHSEYQEELNYYGQQPVAVGGYRLTAPEIPARRVFVNPGHVIGGSVQRHNKPSWVEKKL